MKLPDIKPVVVTDHAVLRYLERQHGFNMELIREHIAGICEAAAAFGAVAVRAEGVKFEIQNGRVVTVVPDGALPCATSRENSRIRLRSRQNVQTEKQRDRQ